MDIVAGVLIAVAVVSGLIAMGAEDYSGYFIIGKLIIMTVAIVICFIIGEKALAIISIVATVISTIINFCAIDNDWDGVGAIILGSLAIVSTLTKVVVAVILFF